MYTQFFGLKSAPFSIAPDPRFLYMSERHREALAHLMYGLQSDGQSSGELSGGALATAGGVALAMYLLIGRKLQRRQSLGVYVTVCYGAAAGYLAYFSRRVVRRCRVDRRHRAELAR